MMVERFSEDGTLWRRRLRALAVTAGFVAVSAGLYAVTVTLIGGG